MNTRHRITPWLYCCLLLLLLLPLISACDEESEGDLVDTPSGEEVLATAAITADAAPTETGAPTRAVAAKTKVPAGKATAKATARATGQAAKPTAAKTGQAQPTGQATVKATAQPTPETGQESRAQWLIMFYMDADDATLEKDMFIDLNEAERVGSTDQMHLVAQIDRYKGGFRGDGNWKTAKRFYLTQDADLTAIHSQELADLGEVNMADGDTLVDFVTWAIGKYPAQKVALVLSDHGAGWPGGWFDPEPGGTGEDDVALAESMGDGIWLMELDRALSDIRHKAALNKLDLIGFDACLMGQVEVFAAMAPHARYAVASQEVEPSLGWAYTSVLATLAKRPQMDAATLSRLVVDTYIAQDQLIVDDKARGALASDLLGTKDASAEEVAQEMGGDITLSAVDLAAMPAVMKGLDDLVYALAEADQDVVAEARAYALSYENTFDKDLPSPAIDLGNFLDLLVDYDLGDRVTQAAQGLRDVLGQAVIAEKHGQDRDGATGMSVHFPVFEMYDDSDNLGYTTIAAPFTATSQWDEYLYFHFTNEAPAGEGWAGLDLWEADGDSSGGDKGRAGAEGLEVEPVTLSGEVATADEPVTMETTIYGAQLAYIYVFLGHLEDDGETLILDDMDYLDAGQTRIVGGVHIPDWGDEEEVGIAFDFEPVMLAINDTQQTVPVLLVPDDYGEDAATYVLEGIYRFADGSEERYARLYFQDEELLKVLGFIGQDGTGAPHEISPSAGDEFSILQQGFSLQEEEAEDFYSETGDTLTFGEEPFTFEQVAVPAGEYVIGFIAEDLDGYQYAQFETIEVQDAE